MAVEVKERRDEAGEAGPWIRVVRVAGRPLMYEVCLAAGILKLTPDLWQAHVFTQYY
jgi:hypothetical protein